MNFNSQSHEKCNEDNPSVGIFSSANILPLEDCPENKCRKGTLTRSKTIALLQKTRKNLKSHMLWSHETSGHNCNNPSRCILILILYHHLFAKMSFYTPEEKTEQRIACKSWHWSLPYSHFRNISSAKRVKNLAMDHEYRVSGDGDSSLKCRRINSLQSHKLVVGSIVINR